MRLVLLIGILLQMNTIIGQSYKDSVLEFQSHLNAEYQDSEKSPLEKSDVKKFKGHDFFPIDENFKVKAEFKRVDKAVPFLMKTTTDRLPTYEIYGVATFELNNQKLKLNIYQSHSLRDTEEYKDYLFLPFTDLTNGDETYVGGRFIDLEIPKEDFIIIDFNKAYNPYCAYSPKYSCPIPPKENDLPIHIYAGIKLKPHSK
ncbi:DUF1684 domain-containing protein [Muricauda sp. JGD-17]|uniref:DUF1684 domain-containing protein n=1 Tax=Flagellimonas ochracea TaxID=2696472 RepID=A0A964WYP1_9FLAO|nr:DUF1684 domain-containing protein [Allomuricauda ochracea]NAY93431.1 DUF1684 domain-containing protein [Allomuricauda ochracea]